MKEWSFAEQNIKLSANYFSITVLDSISILYTKKGLKIYHACFYVLINFIGDDLHWITILLFYSCWYLLQITVSLDCILLLTVIELSRIYKINRSDAVFVDYRTGNADDILIGCVTLDIFSCFFLFCTLNKTRLKPLCT